MTRAGTKDALLQFDQNLV